MKSLKKQAVFVDVDNSFLNQSKQFSRKLKREILTTNNIEQLLELIKTKGDSIDIVALNIDSYKIWQIKSIRETISEKGFSHIKILSISSPTTKVSMATLEKIRHLNPLGLINKSHDTTKTLARIIAVIFDDNPQRRNPRAILQFPVTCKCAGKKFEAVSHSLSRDGIFVVTNQCFTPEDPIEITFSIPVYEKVIKTKCKFLYALIDEDKAFRVAPSGVGLLFLDLKDDVKKIILQYVKDNQ